MANLLRKPVRAHGKTHDITPQTAGWRYVGFSLHHLDEGEIITEYSDQNEILIVMIELKYLVLMFSAYHKL